MCEKVMCDDGIEREVISPKQARESNLPRYFTGKPCKNGHIAERATNTRTCISCSGAKSTEQIKQEEEDSKKDKWVEDDDGHLRKIISRQKAMEEGIDTYFTGKPCKHGHVSLRDVKLRVCLVCESKRHKDYFWKNRDEILEKKKAYREENKDKIKEYTHSRYWSDPERMRNERKEFYYNNLHKCRKQARDYARNNRDKCNARSLERHHRLLKEDPTYRMAIQCRSMFRRVLDMTLKEKKESTFKALGYGPEDLRARIESLFLEGMTWDNYGEWHIDHTTPIKLFLKEGVEDPAEINALDNLNPMWAHHNREKGDKTLGEYLTERPDLVPLYGHLLKE